MPLEGVSGGCIANDRFFNVFLSRPGGQEVQRGVVTGFFQVKEKPVIEGEFGSAFPDLQEYFLYQVLG